MKIALIASVLASAFASISDCGGLFKITQLAQIPDTYVKPGTNTTLLLKYDVPYGYTLNGGKVTTSLSLNGIPFSPSTNNLCETVSCPIIPGSYDGSSWATFPDVTGKIVSKVIWTDSDNQQLLCLKSTFTSSSLENNHNGLPSHQIWREGPIRYLEFGSYSSEGSSTETPSTSSSTHGGNHSTALVERPSERITRIVRLRGGH